MLEYKVTYFNAGAVGEPIRWILRYAKVPFEDERIEFADWPATKARFPLGQIPALEENGVTLTQSGAIIRYLGRKYGLVTGDELFDFRVDQVCEILVDLRIKWRDAFFGDEAKKEEALKNVLVNEAPSVLRQLNDIVSQTQNGPFIAGSKVTYGDFCLAHWLSVWTKTLSADLLKAYPNLASQMEAVLAIPAIKKWVDERPTTIV